MTVNAITDTKKGRTGIAPTYLHTTRQFSACQTPRRCIYPSMFNSFPVIRTASAKNRRFHVGYRSLHFCFPWRRPCDYHAICSMDGKTIQCYFYHIFVSPGEWGRPWGNHAKCYMDGKRIRCLQIASLNVPI